MAKKREPKNEFRFNYNENHPNYIFEKDGNDFHALGITHKRKTYDVSQRKWKKNMPLQVNPQHNRNDRAYIRYGVISQDERTFSNKQSNGFSFSGDDISKVKSKIRNFKKHRR